MVIAEPKRASGEIIDIDTIVDGVIHSGRTAAAIREKLSSAVGGSGPITPEMLDRLEVAMMALPEHEIPVSHCFTEKSYVREVTIPVGLLVLGHSHKEPHICVALRGRMFVLNSDRTTTKVVAPCSFIAGAGRKLVLVTEEMTFQNIHDTTAWPAEIKRTSDAENIDRIEELLYRRTDNWKNFTKRKQLKAEQAKELK